MVEWLRKSKFSSQNIYLLLISGEGSKMPDNFKKLFLEKSTEIHKIEQ
jgi:hypothetical protein